MKLPDEGHYSLSVVGREECVLVWIGWEIDCNKHSFRRCGMHIV